MSDSVFEFFCRFMGIGLMVIAWLKLEISGSNYPYPPHAEPVTFVRFGLIFLSLGWLSQRLRVRSPSDEDTRT